MHLPVYGLLKNILGHRDCPSSIKPKLREVLKELVLLYPHINYAFVLERMTPKRDEFDIRD